ncbi:MAG: arginine repressor [Candidatus Azobacteroides sp.]|nr:arginine repressor [Candidatus Azobacteroides sp.]
METKQQRQAHIRKIISENRISSQEELLQLIISSGLNLTQATLSRYLKEMKVVKVPDAAGEYVYVFSDALTGQNAREEEIIPVLPVTGFLSIEFSGDLAVIKTSPGYASGVASVIDRGIKTEILGTIAGDDTILLIPREGFTRKQILEALNKYFPVI